MPNSREVHTDDIGEMILGLLSLELEDAKNQTFIYDAGDGVEIKSFTLADDGPSDIFLTTDTGEVFAIRVTRVG